MIPRHIDIEHKERFANYVLTTIDNSMMKSPAEDEQKHKANGKDVYLQKVFKLVQMLLDLDLRTEALHALVLVKSLYRRDSIRIAEQKHKSVAHKRIDEAIRCLVDESQIPDTARSECDLEQHLREPVKHGYKISIAGLTWCCSRARKLDLTFWNFASAASVLRTACMNYTCDPVTNLYASPRRKKQKHCLHQNSLNILDSLEKKAWSEIRANTIITVGTILPAELTEKVFQYALEAACIFGSRPGTSEIVMVQPPEWNRAQNCASGLEPPRAQPYLRIKDGYRCPRMDDRHDGIVKWDQVAES